MCGWVDRETSVDRETLLKSSGDLPVTLKSPPPPPVPLPSAPAMALPLLQPLLKTYFLPWSFLSLTPPSVGQFIHFAFILIGSI